ncbi:MAG TPA: hypothetical protein VH482_25965 [Thermomicrobiales bacterium]
MSPAGCPWRLVTRELGSDGSGTSVESANLGPADGIAVESRTSLTLHNHGPAPTEALLVVIAGIAP